MMSCWEDSKWRSWVRKSVTYEVIRTTREFDVFAPQWSALWQEDPHATPFQSPEWLLPWWHQFGQPELRAVVISQDARLIGFLPFYIYREPDTGERQLLLLGVGTTDYLDGIFSPACTQEYVQAALDLMCAEKDWDILSASQSRRRSMLFQALQQSPGLSIRQFDGESCSQMPAVRMAELPQKIRRNAMYYRNRAMRLGKLELTLRMNRTGLNRSMRCNVCTQHVGRTADSQVCWLTNELSHGIERRSPGCNGAACCASLRSL
jgi:hypothetical protein